MCPWVGLENFLLVHLCAQVRSERLAFFASPLIIIITTIAIATGNRNNNTKQNKHINCFEF